MMLSAELNSHRVFQPYYGHPCFQPYHGIFCHIMVESTNGTVQLEVRFQLGVRSYAYDGRLYLREKTVRCLNRPRAPEQRLRFRKKTSLARDMLAG